MMRARPVDDHTFVLEGDRRGQFRAGTMVKMGHGPDQREAEVVEVAYADGLTTVTVSSPGPGRPQRGASPGGTDLWTRIALRVHALMARASSSAGTNEAPGIIHDARRYDWIWGWLFGRSDGAIIRLLDVRRGERVLEVGCGPGNLARALRDAIGPAGSVTAIDASPEMIKRAQRKMRGGPIRFEVARAEQIPYPDASFDAVVSRLVLHELDDLDAALGEIRRVLAPGGRCLLIDLPGHALDGAAVGLATWNGAVRSGAVGFPFFRYVSFGLDRA